MKGLRSVGSLDRMSACFKVAMSLGAVWPVEGLLAMDTQKWGVFQAQREVDCVNREELTWYRLDWCVHERVCCLGVGRCVCLVVVHGH